MKRKHIFLVALIIGVGVLAFLGGAATIAGAIEPEVNFLAQAPTPVSNYGTGAVENWFTYQGYLEDNDSPVSDNCDFQFSLWDSAVGGTQIGTTETAGSLAVSEGLFSHTLNTGGEFGAQAFNGQSRYLQIAARCPAGSGVYTTLAPRQLLSGAPYALSLRPGAVISASQTNALLTAVNAGSGAGLEGQSTSGMGVYGSTSSTGSVGAAGVQSGYSISDVGGYWKPGGFFGGRNGVIGVTKANTGYGVFGWDKAAAGGWAGFFLSNNGNGVYVSAPNAGLNVAGGTKNAVVRTDAGSRLMYSEESTGVWFSDYGFGQLQDGKAVVAIDPMFAQAVNLSEPYHVFLQAYADAELYVTNRSIGSFEVHLRDGEANAEFSYRIVALRRGYEAAWMEPAPWADNDPNLYPEKAIESMQAPPGGEE